MGSSFASLHVPRQHEWSMRKSLLSATSQSKLQKAPNDSARQLLPLSPNQWQIVELGICAYHDSDIHQNQTFVVIDHAIDIRVAARSESGQKSENSAPYERQFPRFSVALDPQDLFTLAFVDDNLPAWSNTSKPLNGVVIQNVEIEALARPSPSGDTKTYLTANLTVSVLVPVDLLKWTDELVSPVNTTLCHKIFVLVRRGI